MKIIPFNKKPPSPSLVNVELPNRVSLKVHPDRLADIFNNPAAHLSVDESNGLIMLAIAIIAADNRKFAHAP